MSDKLKRCTLKIKNATKLGLMRRGMTIFRIPQKRKIVNDRTAGCAITVNVYHSLFVCIASSCRGTFRSNLSLHKYDYGYIILKSYR